MSGFIWGYSASDPVALLANAFRQRRLVVFCGAGISINSGMPTAYDLVSALTDALPCSPGDGEAIKNAGLPFEVFLQVLAERIPLKSVTSLFAEGAPTTTHHFLAKLAEKGWLNTVCTTNFDILLEHAFARQRLRAGRDYERLWTLEDFSHYVRAYGQRWLVKLHGSIDQPDGLAATIQSVALRQSRPEQLTLLERLFGNDVDRGVVILGYSGSDKFDIMPQLRCVADPHAIPILVTHVPGAPVLGASLAPISNSPRSKQWSFFRSAWEVCVDVDLLVRALWNELLSDPYEFQQRTTGWRVHVSEWGIDLKKRGRSIALRTVGRLFEEAGDAGNSQRYMEAALQSALDCNDLVEQARANGDIGRIANMSGDYRKAVLHGRRALSAARTMADVTGIAAQLGNLGLAYYNLGRYPRALTLHRKSWFLARGAGAERIRANQLGNIGLVYRSMGRFGRAAKCHCGSIQINRRLGGVTQEAKQWGNLSLCYKYLEDFAQSERCNQRSMELLIQVGNLRGAAIARGNLGVLRQLKHDYRNALRLFRQALAEARRSEDCRSIVNHLNSMAEVALSTNKPRRAATLAVHALAAAAQSGHRYSLGMTHVTAGRACLELRLADSALDHAERALTILEALVPSGHPYRKAAMALLVAAKRMPAAV